MNSATSVQVQMPGYLVQSVTVHPATKRTVEFGSQRSQAGPTAVGDLSLIYPDDVVSSSELLDGRTYLHLRCGRQCLNGPCRRLRTTASSIRLGPSVVVTVRIGDESFEQTLEPGDITIVPAGLSMQWRQQISRQITCSISILVHIFCVRPPNP